MDVRMIQTWLQSKDFRGTSRGRRTRFRIGPKGSKMVKISIEMVQTHVFGAVRGPPDQSGCLSVLKGTAFDQMAPKRKISWSLLKSVTSSDQHCVEISSYRSKFILVSFSVQRALPSEEKLNDTNQWLLMVEESCSRRNHSWSGLSEDKISVHSFEKLRPNRKKHPRAFLSQITRSTPEIADNFLA